MLNKAKNRFKKGLYYLILLVVVQLWIREARAVVIVAYSSPTYSGSVLENISLVFSFAPGKTYFSEKGAFSIDRSPKSIDDFYIILTHEASFPSLYHFDGDWAKDTIKVYMEPKRFWEIPAKIEIKFSHYPISKSFVDGAIVNRIDNKSINFFYPLTKNVARIAIIADGKQAIVKTVPLTLIGEQYWGEVKIPSKEINDAFPKIEEYIQVRTQAINAYKELAVDKIIQDSSEKTSNDKSNTTKKNADIQLKLRLSEIIGNSNPRNFVEKSFKNTRREPGRIKLAQQGNNSSFNKRFLFLSGDENLHIDNTKFYRCGDHYMVLIDSTTTEINIRKPKYFISKSILSRISTIDSILLVSHWPSEFVFRANVGIDALYMHFSKDSASVRRKEPPKLAPLPRLRLTTKLGAIQSAIYFRGVPALVSFENNRKMYYEAKGYIGFDPYYLIDLRESPWHPAFGITYTYMRYKEVPLRQAEDNLKMRGITVRCESKYFMKNNDWFLQVIVEKLLYMGKKQHGVHTFSLPDWGFRVQATHYTRGDWFWGFHVSLLPPFDYGTTHVLAQKALAVSVGIHGGWWNKKWLEGR